MNPPASEFLEIRPIMPETRTGAWLPACSGIRQNSLHLRHVEMHHFSPGKKMTFRPEIAGITRETNQSIRLCWPVPKPQSDASACGVLDPSLQITTVAYPAQCCPPRSTRPLSARTGRPGKPRRRGSRPRPRCEGGGFPIPPRCFRDRCSGRRLRNRSKPASGLVVMPQPLVRQCEENPIAGFFRTVPEL